MVKLTTENRRSTLTECFAHFGVPKAGNVRRWWADKAPDGQVVVTLWTDHFNGALTRFSVFDREDLPKWKDRAENRKRCKLLQEVGIGGVFQSIIQHASDSSAVPRTTTERYIGNPMRLTGLNVNTGEFSAEEIGT